MIESFLDVFHSFLSARGLGPEAAQLATRATGVAIVVGLACVAQLIAKRIILRVVAALIRRSRMTWDDEFLRAGVFARLSHLVPALVVDALGAVVLGDTPNALALVENATTLYLIVIGLGVIDAVLNAAHNLFVRTETGARVPVKGFVQAVKLVVFIVGGIFILSTLFGKTPLYFLSGLGALTAVLLLVFRDALLGFVAGIMISVNQMVRVGDWIEMPKAGADGDVIDVSLTTVKVQNWDRTITTIPAYALISESFKNWRGMSESGGRRIKRALLIDQQTVAFANEAEIARWKRIRHLRPYLEEKLEELRAANAGIADDLAVLGNGRRLTNLGTFRAYCIAYLRAHPHIHPRMTFLVRQLAPTEHGLPLEIYVFTSDTRWAAYEAIQADVFDHLLAVIGEFGLRVFQEPSGQAIMTAASAFAARREQPAPLEA